MSFCTFCDTPVAHDDIELCEDCHETLCPKSSPSSTLSRSESCSLSVKGPGTIKFLKGDINFLTVTHGWDPDPVSIAILSARSGRTVGTCTSVTHGRHTDVHYTVQDLNVTHIRICVACGTANCAHVVPDGLYLQQVLIGVGSINAECAWNLRNLAVSSSGQAVMVNRCTNQWILLDPITCAAQQMTPIPPCLSADFALDSTISSVCWTESGLILASTGYSGQVIEMDTAGVALRTMMFPCATGAIACCCHYIAVTTMSDIDTYKRVFILDYEDGECVWAWGSPGTEPGCLNEISAIRFMPDKAHVVVAGSLAWISLFTVEGHLIRILGVGFPYGSDIEVVDAGRTVVAIVAEEGTRMITLSTKTGKYTGSIDCHEAGQLTCLATSGQELLAFDTTLSRLFRYR